MLRKTEMNNEADFNEIIKNWPRYAQKRGFELIDF